MPQLNHYTSNGFKSTSTVNVYQNGTWNNKTGYVYWNGLWNIFTKQFFTKYNTYTTAFAKSKYIVNQSLIAPNGDVYLNVIDSPGGSAAARRLLRYSKSGSLLNNTVINMSDGGFSSMIYDKSSNMVYGVTGLGNTIMKFSQTCVLQGTGTLGNILTGSSIELRIGEHGTFANYIYMYAPNQSRVHIINKSTLSLTNTLYTQGQVGGIVTAYNSSMGRNELWVLDNMNSGSYPEYQGEAYIRKYTSVTGTVIENHYIQMLTARHIMNVNGNIAVSYTLHSSRLEMKLYSPTMNLLSTNTVDWKGNSFHDDFITDGTDIYTSTMNFVDGGWEFMKIDGSNLSMISRKTLSSGGKVYLNSANSALFSFVDTSNAYQIYEFTDIK